MINSRALFLAACMALSGGVQAQAPAGGWTFELSPYLWGAAMKGSVQSGALPQVKVDVTFGDILNSLDFGLMGGFEARNGRWGVLFDGIYMKLEHAGSASRTGPGPIGASASAAADLEVAQTMLGMAAAYRVSEARTLVDAIGGLRYARLEADATVDAALFAQSGRVSGSASKDWIDPYIGIRVQQPLAPRWTLVGYADVGGFGIGSDFTWQALLGVNYEVSKTFVAKAGYRYISVDYDKGGFAYDMANSGPYLGVGIRF